MINDFSDYPPQAARSRPSKGNPSNNYDLENENKWDLIFEKRAHNVLVIMRRGGNPQGYITIFESDRDLWTKIGEKMLELQQV